MISGRQGVDLAVDGLSWTPRGGRKLLDEISFALPAGERLALIGADAEAGAALLRVLSRTSRPKHGEIRIGDEDIRALKADVLSRDVATLLQEGEASFPFCVREVVLMGRFAWRRGVRHWSDADRAATENALLRLGLEDLAERQFTGLTGGQRQRVLLARALAQEPRLLLVDRFSDTIDIGQQRAILAQLRDVGMTMVACLPDMDLAAEFATCVGVVENGQMTAFGQLSEILALEREHAVAGDGADRAALRKSRSSGSSASRHDEPRA